MAFAAIPPAAHSPSRATPTPSTSTCGPWATKGSTSTKATKGISTTSRRPSSDAGVREAMATTVSSTASIAYGHASR